MNNELEKRIDELEYNLMVSNMNAIEHDRNFLKRLAVDYNRGLAIVLERDINDSYYANPLLDIDVFITDDKEVAFNNMFVPLDKVDIGGRVTFNINMDNLDTGYYLATDNPIEHVADDWSELIDRYNDYLHGNIFMVTLYDLTNGDFLESQECLVGKKAIKNAYLKYLSELFN